jgi:hypothetical protein
MKFFSEVIVLYDDVDMPSESKFCPSFWQAERFDSDGDYYWDGMSARWTSLKLSKIYKDDSESSFELNVYREKNREFEPGVEEVNDLARYVGYKDEGRYARVDKINNAGNLCVASLSIMTGTVEDYREYLEATHFFLIHTSGIAANLCGFDAKMFAAEFLG